MSDEPFFACDGAGRPQTTGTNSLDQFDAIMAHRNAQAAGALELRTGCGLPNESSCGQEESFTEADLLLPNWQLIELAKAASRLGLTTGQLLRRLIWIYLARLD